MKYWPKFSNTCMKILTKYAFKGMYVIVKEISFK